jgi:hypothetical protein
MKIALMMAASSNLPGIVSCEDLNSRLRGEAFDEIQVTVAQTAPSLRALRTHNLVVQAD